MSDLLIPLYTEDNSYAQDKLYVPKASSLNDVFKSSYAFKVLVVTFNGIKICSFKMSYLVWEVFD